MHFIADFSETKRYSGTLELVGTHCAFALCDFLPLQDHEPRGDLRRTPNAHNRIIRAAASDANSDMWSRLATGHKLVSVMNRLRVQTVGSSRVQLSPGLEAEKATPLYA